MKALLLMVSNRWQHRVGWSLLIIALFLLNWCSWAGPVTAGGSDLNNLSLIPEKPVSLFTTPAAEATAGWINGPEKASLGEVADIEIPNGYRLIGKEGARVLLERTRNPVPQGLIGILAPESGQWWVVLEYAQIGYLKDADKQSLDATTILKAVQSHAADENQKREVQGFAPVVTVEWDRSPVYDAANHSLEWAFQAGTQTARTINYTVLLLGRSGVLEITAVQPYRADMDLAPIKQLAGNISFKKGQGYADYQSGDMVASISLPGLIIDDEKPVSGKALAAGTAWLVQNWGFSVMAGGVVSGVCLLCLQIRRSKAGRKISSNNDLESAAREPVVANNGRSNGKPNGKNNGWGDLKMDLEKALKNGSRRRFLFGGSKQDRRKKIFNYPKFYTDFVMMSNQYPNGGAPINGKSRNGNKEATTTPGSKAEGLMVDLELIACHKALLEQQKQLIQQQTKLIEEKNKLIEEQTEFLRRRAAMMKDQCFLQLD